MLLLQSSPAISDSDIKKLQGKIARTANTIEKDVVSHKRKSMKPDNDDQLNQALCRQSMET